MRRDLMEKALLIGILFAFVISLAYSFLRLKFLASLAFFYSFSMFGLSLYVLDDPRKWYISCGLILFSYLLVILANISNPSLNALALVVFLAFILSTYAFGPRTFKAEVLLSDSKWAVVRTDGSAFVGVPKGIYGAKSKKGIKKGDSVIVEVTRKWGEREMRILKRT